MGLVNVVRVDRGRRCVYQALGPEPEPGDAYAALDAVETGNVTNTPNNVHAITAWSRLGFP